MPRPRNSELEAMMKRAAWESFLERGYRETTYQVIANACDTSKQLVQHYFPKCQDLALSFLTHLGAIVKDELQIDGSDPAPDNPYRTAIDSYRSMQVFFSYLLGSESTRTFLCEILEDRSLSGDILICAAPFTPFRAQFREVAPSDIKEEFIADMGGLLELLYRHLRDGFEFDFHSSLLKVATNGSSLWHGDVAKAKQAAGQARIPDDAMTAIVRRIQARIL